MIITIPEFVSEWQDEFDILLFAWFYRVAATHGFNNEYIMYADDCRTIAQKFYITPNFYYGEKKNTYKWVHFGHYSEYTAVFKWRKIPKVVEYEVKGPKAHLIWGYLLGREADEELVYSDGPKYYRNRTHVLSTQERKKFKYQKYETDEET